MKKIAFGLVTALKEHLLEGNPLTQLEAVTLFGVSSITPVISDMRREGWVIESKRVPYVKALVRMGDYCAFSPPKNLPTKEIHLTEYWVNQ